MGHCSESRHSVHRRLLASRRASPVSDLNHVKQAMIELYNKICCADADAASRHNTKVIDIIAC